VTALQLVAFLLVMALLGAHWHLLCKRKGWYR